MNCTSQVGYLIQQLRCSFLCINLSLLEKAKLWVNELSGLQDKIRNINSLRSYYKYSYYESSYYGRFHTYTPI